MNSSEKRSEEKDNVRRSLFKVPSNKGDLRKSKAQRRLFRDFHDEERSRLS